MGENPRHFCAICGDIIEDGDNPIIGEYLYPTQTTELKLEETVYIHRGCAVGEKLE